MCSRLVPPLTPPVVLEVLRNPLAGVDAAALFDRTIPADLRAFADLAPAGGAQPFDALLDRYIAELANAQAELMGAVGNFDEAALLRELPAGIDSERLVALASAVDLERLALSRRLFLDATARFVRALRAPGMRFPPPQRFQSAIGLVIIGSPGADHHPADAALIIDPGGDDVYERAPAMGGAISVVIDLDGNDATTAATSPCTALRDHRFAGNDSYAASGPGLGAAIAGIRCWPTSPATTRTTPRSLAKAPASSASARSSIGAATTAIESCLGPGVRRHRRLSDCCGTGGQ